MRQLEKIIDALTECTHNNISTKPTTTIEQLEKMIDDLVDILSDIEDRVKSLEWRDGQLSNFMSRARKLLDKINKDTNNEGS